MDQPGNHIPLRGSNRSAAADRMRELLARTVQDHVADQQSNAGALEEIRHRIEGLEWLVKEVREREIRGVSARLDGLAHHMAEAAARPPQWAESLAKHIEMLRAQVTPAAELPSASTAVGTSSEHVEQAPPRLQSVCDIIGQALDALRSQDERLSKLQDSLGRLQQSMETAASRFSRLDNAVAELGQRTGRLDREISAVKGRAEVGFSVLAAKVDTSAEATDGRVTQAVETVTAAVDGLAASMTGVGGRVAALDTRLERLDERLDDQYDRVSAIDNTLAATDTKLGAVDGRLDGLDGRLEGMGTQIDGLDRRLEGMGEKFDGLGEKFDGLGEKFGTFEGKLEITRSRAGPAEIQNAVARIVGAAQRDVDSHLSSLEETVLTLAEALLRPPGRPVPPRREALRG
jgi:chromosome segregation ATPase